VILNIPKGSVKHFGETCGVYCIDRKSGNFEDYRTVYTPIFACYSEGMYNYRLMKKSLLLAVILLFCGLTQAQNYKQHPLFIFSFTRYIQWPEAYTTGDFEILVLGDSPLIDELKELAKNKKVGDRAIKVVKINAVSEIRKCNMLFVPADKSDKLAEVMQKIDTQSVLLMTEQAGLGAQGSCVNFIIKEGRLAFELNQAALTKRNLKASNELTRIATMI
jgi:hypothetical protein